MVSVTEDYALLHVRRNRKKFALLGNQMQDTLELEPKIVDVQHVVI
jgi:hypothetical protein